jgi:hypothetical protein
VRNRGFFSSGKRLLPPTDSLVCGEYLLYQYGVIRIILIKFELISLTVAIENFYQSLHIVIGL